jgi:hypothetical protein
LSPTHSISTLGCACPRGKRLLQSLRSVDPLARQCSADKPVRLENFFSTDHNASTLRLCFWLVPFLRLLVRAQRAGAAWLVRAQRASLPPPISRAERAARDRPRLALYLPPTFEFEASRASLSCLVVSAGGVGTAPSLDSARLYLPSTSSASDRFLRRLPGLAVVPLALRFAHYVLFQSADQPRRGLIGDQLESLVILFDKTLAERFATRAPIQSVAKAGIDSPI